MPRATHEANPVAATDMVGVARDEGEQRHHQGIGQSREGHPRPYVELEALLAIRRSGRYGDGHEEQADERPGDAGTGGKEGREAGGNQRKRCSRSGPTAASRVVPHGMLDS